MRPIIHTSVPIHATLYLRKVTTGEPKSLASNRLALSGPRGLSLASSRRRAVVYQSHISHPPWPRGGKKKPERTTFRIEEGVCLILQFLPSYHGSSMLMVRGVVCTQRHKVSHCHQGAPLAYSPPSPTFHFSFLLTC